MYNVYVYTVYVYTCIIPVGVDTKLQLQPAMVHDLDHNPISLNHVGKLPMFQTPEVDGFGATISPQEVCGSLATVHTVVVRILVVMMIQVIGQSYSQQS